MPSITEKKNKFSDQDASQDPGGAGGSPVGGPPVGEATATPRSVRERLPSEVRGLLSDELVDELLAGARGEEEIVGPGGLLAGLTKRLVERAMEVELTDHLGDEHSQPPPGGAGNEIDTPRDRNGTFEPRIVRTDLVLDALRMALATRDRGAQVELVHHSDAGSQGGLNRLSQRDVVAAIVARSPRGHCCPLAVSDYRQRIVSRGDCESA